MIRERFPNSQIVNNVRVDAKTKSKMFSSRVGLFTSRVKKLSRTMSNSRVLFAELFSARVFCQSNALRLKSPTTIRSFPRRFLEGQFANLLGIWFRCWKVGRGHQK